MDEAHSYRLAAVRALNLSHRHSTASPGVAHQFLAVAHSYARLAEQSDRHQARRRDLNDAPLFAPVPPHEPHIEPEWLETVWPVLAAILPVDGRSSDPV